MKPTSPFQFGPRRWRAAWRARRVGGDRTAHQLERELDVVGTSDADLEPIAAAGPQSDPVIASELVAALADEGSGQPEVEGTVGVDVGDLPPAHSERRDWSKRPFGNGGPGKSAETLDELLLHAIGSSPKEDDEDEGTRKAN